jgi:ethanolamine ammonia-lyase large subunit
MKYRHTIRGVTYNFDDLRVLLAKASPLRSGDELAGIAAVSSSERVAAQMALADIPLSQFLNDVVIPYETDEVTRLIVDSHDAAAFSPIGSFTVANCATGCWQSRLPAICFHLSPLPLRRR